MAFNKGNVKAGKLTASEVLRIRELYQEGTSQGALSRAFNISVNQIGRIVRGESWQQYSREPVRERWDTQAAAQMSEEEAKASIGRVIIKAQDPNCPIPLVIPPENEITRADYTALQAKMNKTARSAVPEKFAEKALEALLEDKERPNE